MNIGTPEIVGLIVLVLILFGGKKIPEIMRGLGEGLREFRKASSSAQNEIKRFADEEPAPSESAPAPRTAAPTDAQFEDESKPTPEPEAEKRTMEHTAP